MHDTVLDGITVIDLTHYVAGPYATKLMAGFGAEVIKVEKPGCGDDLRSHGPFYNGKTGGEKSIPFLWLNTGKKSITLDICHKLGRGILLELIKKADLLVENFSPRVMADLNLGYEVLQEINPELIMVSISNYGSTGERRDYLATEMELQAASGVMHLTGQQDKPPLSSGPLICQYSAGQHAYLSAIMALFERETTGKGQHIDISIQECGVENIEISMTKFLHTGQESNRGSHMMVPWETYECKNGYVTVIAMPYRNWEKSKTIFHNNKLYEDKFEALRDRITHRDEYEALLKPSIQEFEKEELFHLGQAVGLAFGYVAEPDEVLSFPQHKERAFFQEIDHPEVGKHLVCSAPFLSSQTRWELQSAPLLGENNNSVYSSYLGYSEERLREIAIEGVI